MWIGSVGEAMPPLAMTFTKWAPARSSSRAANRTASTPSHSRPMAPTRCCNGARSSERIRLSQWPPVWLSALPEITSRGPCTAPIACASTRPRSAPPTSRTVVKPRASIAPMICPARSAASDDGCAALAAKSAIDATTCTCASIRPGISTRPPRSIRVAAADTIGRSDTSRITPLSVSTSMPPRGPSCRGSSTSPPVNRYAVMAAPPQTGYRPRGKAA